MTTNSHFVTVAIPIQNNNLWAYLVLHKTAIERHSLAKKLFCIWDGLQLTPTGTLLMGELFKTLHIQRTKREHITDTHGDTMRFSK